MKTLARSSSRAVGGSSFSEGRVLNAGLLLAPTSVRLTPNDSFSDMTQVLGVQPEDLPSTRG